ncbi:MAG: RluA family pseudouridine synthase [Dehalococcoidia bacterium]
MEEQIELIVEETGGRLDRYIASHTELSRGYVQKLIREGMVLVGGRTARPKRSITVNERIHISIPEPEETELAAENISLNIVFEDADVLVVDKPAGLTVHPGAGKKTGTLVNAILAYCPDLSGIKGTVRPGIVHRLDKDTSGLVMVAKNDRSQASLSEQVKKREIEKGYLSLVSGELSPAEGAIEGPVGRHPGDRKKMAIVSGGREAVTHYKVVEHIGKYTFLEVRPETGRTHQIRVHFSSIGYPLVGDAVYGGDTRLIKRQFLHAHRLGFRLPGSGAYRVFTSNLPEELSQVLKDIAFNNV